MSNRVSPDAGPAWLPGLQTAITAERRYIGHTVVGASFETPVLDETQAAELAGRVRAGVLEARSSHRVADVVEAVAAAAGRLADPEDAFGSAAVDAVRRASGCSVTAARELLAEHARGWTASVLTDRVREELGDPGLLDSARSDPRRPGRRRRAVGPPLIHLVLAGNVPGVAVTAVIRCLLVRSGVLCKLPSSEPWLVGLFARALHEEDPALGATVAATWWPTETSAARAAVYDAAVDDAAVDDATAETAAVWIKRSGKVVVYGGADAIRALRAQTPPSTPLVEYGPRVGVVLLGPEATDAELDGLARDTFAYEQAGCVSPRLVYLLSGAGPGRSTGRNPGVEALLDRLGVALSKRAARDSAAPLTDAEAVAIREARSATQFGSGGGQVRGPAELGWTILYRRRVDTYSEPLPRVLWAYEMKGIEELAGLRGVLEGRIQAMGIAGVPPAAERQAEDLAVELGVSRVTRPGDMAWPPPDWRHDGRMQLLPLVRWTELETDGGSEPSAR